MHAQGSSAFVPVNKVFFNCDSNFQHKKTGAGYSLSFIMDFSLLSLKKAKHSPSMRLIPA